MTTKEIAAVARVSSRTVTRTARENGIGVVKPGVETVFTELEAVQLMAELLKKGFIVCPLTRRK
jgi:excisionase family DNA binding protein